MIKKGERLLSLDVFRGGVIAGFIVQNNPGSKTEIYTQLLHSQWNGLTIADIGFPFFLFIVGVSLTFSLMKLLEQGIRKRHIYKKIVIRFGVLFILGIIFENFSILIDIGNYSYEAFSTIRVMGVLQRIAITYLAASFLLVKYPKFNALCAWALVSLMMYWIMLVMIPVPGYGAGNLTREGILVSYIDQSLLPGVLLENEFDPEGVLSTISALSTVLLGVLSGWLLRLEKLSQKKKFLGLFIGAAVCLSIGYLINNWFPINKMIWSTSFVMVTGGYALFILAILFWIIEIKKYTRWAKLFQIFGMNTLVIFLFSSLITMIMESFYFSIAGASTNLRLVFYYQIFEPMVSYPKFASLLYGISFLIGLGMFFWYLNKKRVRFISYTK